MRGDYRSHVPGAFIQNSTHRCKGQRGQPRPGWGDTQARGARGSVPKATAAAQPPAKMGIMTISTNLLVWRSCLPTGHDGSVLSATSPFQGNAAF